MVRTMILIACAMAAPVSAHEGHAHVHEVTERARAVAAAMEDRPAPLPNVLAYDFGHAHRVAVDFFPNLVKTGDRGARIGLMTMPQRRAVHALERSALSPEGYLTVNGIQSLEEELRQTGLLTGARQVGDYGLWFFGDVSDKEPWAWKLEGHHLSLNVTVAEGAIRATPLFLGVNPAEVRAGPRAGLRVLAPHQDRALALWGMLTDEQREVANDGTSASAEIVARGVPGDPPPPEGLRAADMTFAQREALFGLIATYARTLRAELAEEELALVRSRGLDEVRFLWRGAAAVGERHYYRVHGPTTLIEFDALVDDPAQGANHVHAQWRNPERDFGADLLRAHYEKDHDGGR